MKFIPDKHMALCPILTTKWTNGELFIIFATTASQGLLVTNIVLQIPLKWQRSRVIFIHMCLHMPAHMSVSAHTVGLIWRMRCWVPVDMPGWDGQEVTHSAQKSFHFLVLAAQFQWCGELGAVTCERDKGYTDGRWEERRMLTSSRSCVLFVLGQGGFSCLFLKDRNGHYEIVCGWNW